jgi:sodium transport system ATP-binding protein
MIRTRELVKIFHDSKRGEVRAVDGVSLEIPDGIIFGLLGPNGAGKTTALRILSTILKPTSGTAEVGGADVEKNPAKVRTLIGFLSGSTGLYERMTAREMIQYYGRLYGMDDGRIAARIGELSAVLDMDDFLDTMNSKLSTGMKQKVSIARTIVHDPPVLIFDEPTTGLDIMAARRMLEFIESAKGPKRTVIFSTHIMSEAERLCDRVAFIYNGKIIAEGTVGELKSQTGSETLADVFFTLIGEAPKRTSGESGV